MNELFIYEHLGLGDHIMCHGLIRTYIETNIFEKYYLFAKKHNTPAVKYMFRDISNLEILPVNDDADVHGILSTKVGARVLVIGFRNLGGECIDKCFYGQAGIDISKKWDNFKIDRDLDREKEVIKIFKAEKPYIFVHEDIKRNMLIDKSYLGKKKIVYPDIELCDNLFHYCSLIEQADEVHCIESSFLHMIDCMGLNKNLYAHRYSKEIDMWSRPIYKNVLKIIEK